ncbi:MAG: adenylate/guanylate cyclase domain-containing protein [Candidatus Marinimicrobia bacterium]|nr:adenylate/guanylate cyclase domain-containing protein [Candidatus Neomarinimicrobiota bacterium]
MLSEKNRTILNSVLIALASVLLIGLIQKNRVLKTWSLHVEDMITRLTNEQKTLQEDVVIIPIDQNSLNSLKNQLNILWPFPRLIYGYVTDYLNHCGAKAIVYDILFPQKDIDRLNISSSTYSDSLFMQSMKQAGNVILAMQMEDSTHQTDNQFYDKKLEEIDINIPQEVIRDNYSRATLPLFKFQEAVRLPGIVNFFPDIDGISRRIPLFNKYNETAIPFLSLSALLVAENINKINYDSISHSIIAGNYKIPLSHNNLFNIRWYGRGGANKSFPYVSFTNLIKSYRQWKTDQKPQLDPEVFKDKAVFIGATAAGLWDAKPTPFSSPQNPFPGVEIYATVYANFINGETVRHIGYFQIIPILLLLLVLFNFIWSKLEVLYSSGITIALFIIPVLINLYSFDKFFTHIPLISIELSILLSLIFVNVVNYLTVNRKRKIIKNVFNRYMHPDVVEQLTNNYEKIKLGGEEIEATVLFTDLLSFTKISEDLQSGQIVELLNSYFEKAENIIFHNSGMLDKYTGDGLMAIYGAPIHSPGHGLQACESILAFRELGEVNIQLNGKSIPLFTRVGGASGKIVVGNIGSSNRMDYTAVGDTVNLAARLEGVNKIYGTNNLISAQTYEMVKDDFVCREVDYIRVKGRMGAVKIYNVICHQEKMTKELVQLLKMHQSALKSYRRRNFNRACNIFSDILEKYPDDSLSNVYKKRCEKLLDNPDIIDEDNIFNMKIK